MELRERKSKSGTVLFFLDYRVEGQRVRENLKGITDRKTAELYLAKRRLEVARGQVGVPTREGCSLGAALKELLETRQASCVPAHIVNLKAHKREIEAFFGEETPIKSLSVAEVNRFKLDLRAKGDKPSTINRKIHFLKAACGLAVRRGYIAHNPVAEVERVSDPSPEVWRFLNEEEVDALLGVLRDGLRVQVERKNGRNYQTKAGQSIPLYCLAVGLLNTAARLGEALSLTWQNVDLKRGELSILTTKHAARGRKAKVRRLHLNQTLRELLEGLQKESGGKPEEKVFRIPRNNLRRKFERACELAGIGHCRIHDLRHTAISFMVSKGIPLHVVKEIAGHSSIQTTMRYAHLQPGAMTTATEVLNLGGAKKTARVVAVGE
jgi:integrase